MEPSKAAVQPESGYPLGRALIYSSLTWVLLLIFVPSIAALYVLFLGLIFNLPLQCAIAYIARRKPWARSRRTLVTLGSALIFLAPFHAYFWISTTPEACFQRHVITPIPDSVSAIRKKGFDSWVAVSFAASPETMTKIIQERPYKPLEMGLAKETEDTIATSELNEEILEMRRKRASGLQDSINFSGLKLQDCDVFRIPNNLWRSITLVVSKDRTKACVVSFRI